MATASSRYEVPRGSLSLPRGQRSACAPVRFLHVTPPLGLIGNGIGFVQGNRLQPLQP